MGPAATVDLFDMGRTSLNAVGGAYCAVCVNNWIGGGKPIRKK